MSLLPQYSVVVPAAGIGKRMKSSLPKQYLNINGKAIIEHTISNLLSHPQINRVVVVLHPEDTFFKDLPTTKNAKIETVEGGQERSDSVLAGINHLPDYEEWVLVHDAARPCLHHEDLSALLMLAQHGNHGGILATPVRDTMKRAQSSKNLVHDIVEHTESRENLWHALTPQFFKLDLLKQAFRKANEIGVNITDEASAIESIGEKVILVEGRVSNIKITQPEDLLLARFYLTQ